MLMGKQFVKIQCIQFGMQLATWVTSVESGAAKQGRNATEIKLSAT